MVFVIGVDVGGTNTDTVILCGTRVLTKAKTPTSEDKTHGIVNSIETALNNLSEETRSRVLKDLARVNIGTTHFTNAVKKRDGKSFDRVAVVRLCGSASRGLPPYADFPGDLKELVFGGRFMISGGLEYNTDEIEPLNPEEVEGCVRQMLEQDPPVKNIVISGIFSPCDDPCGRQEKEIEQIVKSICPEMSCTLSHEIGRLGLLERENAAVLNESLKRMARVTISAFIEALSKLKINCPFYLTQNDGTMISAEEAMRFPVLTFSSGPTNSMRGAAFLSGLFNAIVVDIGGTTTDVGVLRNGFPREASTHVKIGGVRTNFCMPDVQSIPLGGGTLVRWDEKTSSVEVGPNSVEYRIKQEALCFGGDKCTTTDIALAAGVAPGSICKVPGALSGLSSQMVYAAMREIKKAIEDAVDIMKTEKEDVPVLLVGGGSILVDTLVPLKGASRVILPADHWDVANAVGAALGTVGGASDIIVNLGPIKEMLKKQYYQERDGGDEYDDKKLEERAREIALERGREIARDEVITKKGVLPETVYIYSQDISNVKYVMDRVRVTVKAIGTITVEDADTMNLDSKNVLPDSRTDNGNNHSTESNMTQIQTSKDNPFWPNSSAEDRAKDAAANLFPPNVVGAEWILTENDVECLATGAGILGCGGGGDPDIGRLMAIQMLKEGKEMKITNPCRLDATKMGLACGVGFMGAPLILLEKLVGGDETTLALTRLQQVVASGVCEGNEKTGCEGVKVTECKYDEGDGKSFPVYLARNEDLAKISTTNIPLSRQITALTCIEAGGSNSMEPILVGARLGLPVLDVDGMGRAFPEIPMYIPFIYGCGHCPSSLADSKGEALTCTSVSSPQELEIFFRAETVRMGMNAAVATAVMNFDTVLSKTVLFTMSQAWQLGRAVLRARCMHTSVVKAIVEQRNGMVLITGKVIRVDGAKKCDGFTEVISIVEGLERYAGYHLMIRAKNENYVAQRVMMTDMKETEGGGEVLACTPDLITIVDSDTGVPVTTEKIRYGLRVGVVVLPANPLLKTPQALEVVGPRAFKLDMDYREPRSLND